MSYYFNDNLSFSVGAEADLNIGTVYFVPEKDDARTDTEGARISGLVGVSYSLNERFAIGLRYLHAFNHDFDFKFTDNFGNPTSNEVRYSYRSVGVFLKIGLN